MLLVGVQMRLDESRTDCLVIIDKHHDIGVQSGECTVASHRDTRSGLQHVANPRLALLQSTDTLRRTVGGAVVDDEQAEVWV
ncbi:unannotated protein [freshwater metagenome]|uniref:Unannotated protein n=1 Tax=freshwater metagenome TaxID=449393 RepID=A0A6J6ZLH2_9ZZZZ